MKQFSIILTTVVVAFFALEFIPAFKLVAVFFHESSHALMTVVTGGKVAQFVVNPNASGMVMSQGGNRFLILNSGYLGSLIWGLAILYATATVSKPKLVIDGLIVVVSLIGLAWIDDMVTWLIAVSIVLVWFIARHVLAEQLIKSVLYFTACIPIAYIPLDIWGDVIVNSGRSDAFMLAEEYGGTQEMWGFLWLALTATLTYKTITEILKSNKDAFLR